MTSARGASRVPTIEKTLIDLFASLSFHNLIPKGAIVHARPVSSTNNGIGVPWIACAGVVLEHCFLWDQQDLTTLTFQAVVDIYTFLYDIEVTVGITNERRSCVGTFEIIQLGRISWLASEHWRCVAEQERTSGQSWIPMFVPRLQNKSLESKRCV